MRRARAVAAEDVHLVSVTNQGLSQRKAAECCRVLGECWASELFVNSRCDVRVLRLLRASLFAAEVVVLRQEMTRVHS